MEPPASVPSPAGDLDALATQLRDRLLAGTQQATATDLSASARVRALVDRDAAPLGPREREELVRMVSERSFGLGPLETLLADPGVDEIMVNGAGVPSGDVRVWVERGGRLEATDVVFTDEAQLRHAIERILAPLGRRVDEAQPMCDARLPDGSRVNVVIPPLALDGPVLTIRRFRRRAFTPDELVDIGTWTAPLQTFLASAVRARLNILVSGGTGSGKTTTLNALSSFVAAGERIVTIEDTAELALQQPHVVRLEGRPATVEGRGEVTIRVLVRNALRMRPDRIVVGEVRGAEALDMLAAMASGHDGSLCTVHAGSAEEALRRIETLALMADVGLPHAAVREQVAQAIDLVVHQARQGDGSRRVVGVSEVVRVAGGAGTRELYASRRGHPTWRAPLGPELTERLGIGAQWDAAA
jgi:pilus assembly protein CpaF